MSAPDTSDVPAWAWERLDELIRPWPDLNTTREYASFLDRVRGVAARVIAQHEQAPVDPLLIEAREIAAAFMEDTGCLPEARDYRAGHYDDCEATVIALAALRRGIALAEERSK